MTTTTTLITTVEQQRQQEEQHDYVNSELQMTTDYSGWSEANEEYAEIRNVLNRK